ncbi:MAG: mechanosensitive ion channel family protein [Halioglobus sp.]
MNESSISRAVIFFMALYCAATAAQDTEQAAVEHVENLVERFESDIDQWRALSRETGKANDMEAEALLFRQDDRSFRLLADADALALAVAKLPEGNQVRLQVEQKLSDDLENTTETVFLRLAVLDKRIASLEAEMETLGPSARISTQNYLQALEAVRFQYYEALINHYESRKLLGLAYEESKRRLTDILYLHAEALVGQIELGRSVQEGLGARLALDPDNTDLTQAVTGLATRKDEALASLSSATDLLDRLEIDTTDYRTVLLKYSSSVSISLFGSGALRTLFSEWSESLRASVVEHSPDLVVRLLVFILVLFAFRFLSRLTRRVVRASCDRSSLDLSVLLKDILVSASGGSVMILGILMALSQIGISLGPMLTGLGVAGFIVGFALQDTLGNFAAGAMILIYRPYDVDDFVEVTGASGLVKKMNLVSTTITTFDNQTLVIPNSKIWGDVIKNVTAQKLRRVDLEFGIGYKDDIEKTEKILADIVESHELILSKPAATIKLHTLGESSVNFIVRPWTKTGDYWDVYWDITREVKMRFDREGISIPFPQRDVHLHSNVSTD